MKFNEETLFYQWNKRGDETYPRNIELNDETLRDGLQAPGIKQPSLKEKIKILDCIHSLGIDAACIGFPAAGPAMMKHLESMLRHINKKCLTFRVACAARTVQDDIAPIVELSQKFGLSIDANVFVGCSPIRQLVEHWDLDHIVKLVKDAVSFAVNNNIPVCFITEDTTRSKPEHLKRIYETAVEYGAYRVCLCDTVGSATPSGTMDLVGYVKGFLASHSKHIYLDWHGHNDRGLGMANALAAIEAGVDRVHATGLGLGERSGNTSMEQLLINLKLMNLKTFSSIQLKSYCDAVSLGCGYDIPINLPVVGSKVFSTASGVHAAAIIKAQKMDSYWLADRIYSSVPASELGFEQTIEISPMSGKSNVIYLLQKHNINNDALANDIFEQTKKKGVPLTKQEMAALFQNHGHPMN
jgi:2-isopropylmalate synthase